VLCKINFPLKKLLRGGFKTVTIVETSYLNRTFLFTKCLAALSTLVILLVPSCGTSD